MQLTFNNSQYSKFRKWKWFWRWASCSKQNFIIRTKYEGKVLTSTCCSCRFSFSIVYTQVVRKIWVLKLFLCNMIRVQEFYWLVMNLKLCLYSCSIANSWSLIILTVVNNWDCQLKKTFFSNIFPRNYVPKWGEGGLGTMPGLERLGWEESDYNLWPFRHHIDIWTGLWRNMERSIFVKKRLLVRLKLIIDNSQKLVIGHPNTK